jgi:sugar-specific transcriptional regulator TrmB
MTDIKQTLKSLGLDDKEIDLYLAALSLGESNMTELAKMAKVNRSTAYFIFKDLEAQGLLGSYKTKRGEKYVATQPEALIQKAEKNLSDLKSTLPQLHALINKDGINKPKLTYYEGKEGYIAAISDSLNKHGAILRHIGSLTEAHKVYKDYDLNYYLPTRIKNNIFIRCLYTPDQNYNIKNRDHQKELREIRYLPSEFIFNTATLIYENKIVITSSHKELISVVIESKDIAESEKSKFDLMWQAIGPTPKLNI